MAQTSYWALLTLITVSSFASGIGSQTHENCSDAHLAIKDGKYTLTNGFKVGSLLVYDCPHGYYSRVKTRRCQATGKWYPLPRRGLECKMVSCPDPLVFEHGSVQPVQNRYYVNETTTYECFSDYKLYGSATRICKANGKWNGSTPICSRNTDHCPDPGIPAGARRTGHIFNIDDTVTYRCENNLILMGSKDRKCKESGEWTGIEPECRFEHTFDTPEEVAEVFGSSLKHSLSTTELAQNQQEGRRIRLDKSGNLNIYIAIDASDSIDEDHFHKSIDVIKKLIDKISYYEVTPKYDIMIFATKVTSIVDIKDYYIGNPKPLSDVIKDLESFNFDDKGNDSGTNIGAAFNKILEHMSFINTRNRTLFLSSDHVVIMFTDGEANMGVDPKGPVNQIKDFVHGNDDKRLDKLDIYMFGLGEQVDQRLLNEYATNYNGKHVFVLEDMKKLHKTFDDMIDESTSVGLCGLHRDYNYDDKNSKPSDKRQRQPWLAKINVIHDEGPQSNCLGSLVSPRFVLTAAHCFKFGDTSEKISVEIDEKIKEHVVEKHILHPKYDSSAKKDKGIPEYYDFDVALIQLKNDVKITANARPICIPCTMEASGALKLSGTDVKCEDHEKIMLNNKYEEAYIMSPERDMKNVHIKLENARDACIEDSKRAKGITAQKATDIVSENFLCTGGIEHNTDHVACKGDSGGALFTEHNYRTIQVGIVSWGVEDICNDQRVVDSRAHTRDFHINLFKIQPFLKQYLGDAKKGYVPLTFID